jgi:hypothetical protein
MMAGYVEVRHLGVLTKKKEVIPLGKIVNTDELFMSESSVKRRIQQGWLAPKTKADLEGQPAPEEPTTPPPVTTDGLPSPDRVGEMVKELEQESDPEPEQPSEPEADPEPEVDPDPDDEEIEDELEEDPEEEPPVESTPLSELGEMIDEDTLPPPSPLGEPLRDGMGIQEYWDAAESSPNAKNKRLCPQCKEECWPKTALFDHCAEKSTWTMKE